MVHDYHKLDEERGALYDFTDLTAVRLKGDNLESFMNTWEMVLAGIRHLPDQHIIETLFLDQLRHSTVLREEISHYERQDRGHRDRTYEYLVGCVRKYLNRVRQKNNRKALERALSGGVGHTAAPATKAKKAKSKEANQDASPAAPAKGSSGTGKGKGRSGTNPPKPAGTPGAICYEFQKTGKCNRQGCKYEHVRSQSQVVRRVEEAAEGIAREVGVRLQVGVLRPATKRKAPASTMWRAIARPGRSVGTPTKVLLRRQPRLSRKGVAPRDGERKGRVAPLALEIPSLLPLLLALPASCHTLGCT